MTLGMMTRFFKIHFPQTTVFDEVHFGNFTNWYVKGLYFHDIHPPLAKLIMAGVAKYAGYTGNLKFDLEEHEKYSDMIYVSLRSTPAFFGALCVPLSYLVVRAMNCGQFAAAMAALMIASDLTLIVESRHILSDGILHFFACLAIFAIFLFERYPSATALIFEGIALGCVAACKYTSGGIIVLAVLRQIDLTAIRDFRRHFGSLARIAILGILVLAIQIACFWVHLTVLPYFPEEPVGMPATVRTGLVKKATPDWVARQQAAPMLRRIWDLFWMMHHGNMQIRGNHPYASPWWSWPLATRRWVLYWTRDGRHILCMGNILLWYPIFFGVIVSVLRAVLTLDLTSEATGAVLGWLFSYLPFALIPREMFLYHYAIPVIFGVYNLVVLIDKHCPPFVKGYGLLLFTTMAVLGFLRWCPWVYGLSTPDFDFLVWDNRWRG
jgi:dolichyl-phosphate-mannose--protein O-mannosyl transferase